MLGFFHDVFQPKTTLKLQLRIRFNQNKMPQICRTSLFVVIPFKIKADIKSCLFNHLLEGKIVEMRLEELCRWDNVAAVKDD